MSEQFRVPSGEPPKPMDGRSFAPFIPVTKFPSHPRGQNFVHMAQHFHPSRTIKPAVVVHPATHHRIDDLCEILQFLIVPGGSQLPPADRRTDSFRRLGADRWQEAHKERSPTILRASRLEGKAKEV